MNKLKLPGIRYKFIWYKLKLLGITTPLLHWFSSYLLQLYLHGRFQRVAVEGKTPTRVRVVFSIIHSKDQFYIGSLLFSELYNYVLQVVVYKLSLYADGRVLYKTFSNNPNIHIF